MSNALSSGISTTKGAENQKAGSQDNVTESRTLAGL